MPLRHLVLLIGLCGLYLAGCGGSGEPGRHALQGTVTVDGTSIPKGSISFFPVQGVSGRPVTALIEAGEYHFTAEDGPYSGEHRVVIGMESDPEFADEGAAPAPGNGLSSGIKVAPPPEDARRMRGMPPKKALPKTQWEVQCTIEENGDDLKDFNVSG